MNAFPRIPRKIKAFSNTLARLLIGERPTGAHGEIKDRATAAIIVAGLYQFHPAIHRLLQGNPRVFESLSDWCKNVPPNYFEPTMQSMMRSNYPAEIARLRPAFDKELPPTDAPSPESGSDLPDLRDLYVDPSYGNPLRIQRLIAETQITSKDLVPYLEIDA